MNKTRHRNQGIGAASRGVWRPRCIECTFSGFEASRVRSVDGAQCSGFRGRGQLQRTPVLSRTLTFLQSLLDSSFLTETVTRAHSHTCIYICIYIHIHLHIFTHLYVWACLSVCDKHTYIHTYMYGYPSNASDLLSECPTSETYSVWSWFKVPRRNSAH